MSLKVTRLVMAEPGWSALQSNLSLCANRLLCMPRPLRRLEGVFRPSRSLSLLFPRDSGNGEERDPKDTCWTPDMHSGRPRCRQLSAC